MHAKMSHTHEFSYIVACKRHLGYICDFVTGFSCISFFFDSSLLYTASSLTCKKFEWRSIHKSLNRISFGIFHDIFNQIFTEFRSVFIRISFKVINGFEYDSVNFGLKKQIKREQRLIFLD